MSALAQGAATAGGVSRTRTRRDEATIDVATTEEAERVIDGYMRFIDDPASFGIRSEPRSNARLSGWRG